MADRERPEGSDTSPGGGEDAVVEKQVPAEEAGASGAVDDSELHIANFPAERVAAAERLASAWRCRIIETNVFPFDWFAVRSDQPSSLVNYLQHPDSGNVLIPAYRWIELRRYSTAFRLPHLWVIDFFAQGLRYKMYPPTTGISHEKVVIEGEVYVTIPQNDFDILKEAKT